MLKVVEQLETVLWVFMQLWKRRQTLDYLDVNQVWCCCGSDWFHAARLIPARRPRERETYLHEWNSHASIWTSCETCQPSSKVYAHQENGWVRWRAKNFRFIQRWEKLGCRENEARLIIHSFWRDLGFCGQYWLYAIGLEERIRVRGVCKSNFACLVRRQSLD